VLLGAVAGFRVVLHRVVAPAQLHVLAVGVVLHLERRVRLDPLRLDAGDALFLRADQRAVALEVVPHLLHEAPVGFGQRAADRVQLRRGPAVAAHEALPVALVAHVQGHRQRACRFMLRVDLGDERLRVHLAVFEQRRHQLREVARSLRAHLHFLVAGLVGGADDVLPHRAAVGAAVHDARPGGRLHVLGGELLQAQQLLAQHGVRRHVLDGAVAARGDDPLR
jgi:hypothetical protein